ncbi:hypothetical protein JRQ81_015993 [Phrynocephalus forsythii]|uniref:Uncharacterized protein n=1 Tax=Phrynocephalus forsythii TaxID=171643 RepID=A0A9Q0XWY0_9SAUR|nr:hypothetical protein JRQ81_015993 [Phrynocephalus forsythii]
MAFFFFKIPEKDIKLLLMQNSSACLLACPPARLNGQPFRRWQERAVAAAAASSPAPFAHACFGAQACSFTRKEAKPDGKPILTGRAREPSRLQARTMWRTAACLPLGYLLLQLQVAGCFSGDNDHIMAIHQRKSRNPIFVYHHVQSVEKSLDMNDQKDYGHNSHLHSHAKISKLHPAVIVKSTFPRPGYDSSLNLLAMTGEDQELENLHIPATNVITVVSALSLH